MRLDTTELQRDVERVQQELRQLQIDLQVAEGERHGGRRVAAVSEGEGALTVEEARTRLQIASEEGRTAAAGIRAAEAADGEGLHHARRAAAGRRRSRGGRRGARARAPARRCRRAADAPARTAARRRCCWRRRNRSSSNVAGAAAGSRVAPGDAAGADRGLQHLRARPGPRRLRGVHGAPARGARFASAIA